MPIKFKGASPLLETDVDGSRTVFQLDPNGAVLVKPYLINEISISFQGVLTHPSGSGSGQTTLQPIKVEVYYQDDAGASSDISLYADPDDYNNGLELQAKYFDIGSSPNNSTRLMGWYVHPQRGLTWKAPLGGEIRGSGGQRIGIVVTTDIYTNCVCRIVGEE